MKQTHSLTDKDFMCYNQIIRAREEDYPGYDDWNEHTLSERVVSLRHI